MNRMARTPDNLPMTRRSEKGQTTVEAAIVLPAMTFMTLAILQLTMLQHASLMTEYAAYQAARTGIVRNGRVAPMTSAARVALAPTLIGHNGTIPLYPAVNGRIRGGNAGLIDLAKAVAQFKLTDTITGALAGLKIIRVEVVSPRKSADTADVMSFETAKAKTPWTRNKELEFDDIGHPNDPTSTSSSNSVGFLSDEKYRRALLLTIRVRYMYSLEIPFANSVLHLCWLAALSPNVKLTGMFGAEGVTYDGWGTESVVEASGQLGTEAAIKATADERTPVRGDKIISDSDITKLIAARHGGVYLIPLVATHTMRMQSNLYSTDLR